MSILHSIFQRIKSPVMLRFCLFLCVALFPCSRVASSQTLDDELRQSTAADLAAQSRLQGDAARGAVVFFQHQMACSKCHSVGGSLPSSLGPDLATLAKDLTDESLVESVLLPSKVIRKGFDSVTAVTHEGQTIVGLLVERTPDTLVIRDAARNGEQVTLKTTDLEDIVQNTVSIMPAGQMNQLASRQQFFDLIRYLMDIRDGGAARAKELQPSPSLLTFTVPEYEQHIDHAGMIAAWNTDSLERGEAIYRRVCMNCHGTRDQPGSLPTSLRFASGKFRNGSDPLTMYQTLTRGFGLMAAQTWMVPSQKYDVIHYIRETYLKPHNPTQFVDVDAAFVARLPKGDTRGPEPSLIQPWNAMDYGPSLTHTYEVPGAAHNIAYKGIAVRLDPGAGGVSRGRHWMMFDTDTLRMAAAWSAQDPPSAEQNFIDWRGIQFNGEHQIHPRVTGTVVASNPTGPGWANPATNQFVDDQRVLGRDGRMYGPLPRASGQFRGVYYYGQQVVLSYAIDGTDVLESPSLLDADDKSPPTFQRTFNIGPRARDLTLQIAEQENAIVSGTALAAGDSYHDAVTATAVTFGPVPADGLAVNKAQKFAFDGQTFLEVTDGSVFDMTAKDFTITARVQTRVGGTIFAIAKPEPKWTPDGQTLFVRDGQLTFDIGWVGAVTSKKKIDDGKWHNVAATWTKSSQQLQLFIDGKPDGKGTLAAGQALTGSVARIGFTAPDFPGPEPYFEGELAEVRFYQRRLTDELKTSETLAAATEGLIARWDLTGAGGASIPEAGGHTHEAVVRRGDSPGPANSSLLAGFSPAMVPLRWSAQDGRLTLTIPAGAEPLKFTTWISAESSNENPEASRNPVITNADQDLKPFTLGGPPRWSQKMTTAMITGADSAAFATDILAAPESNPWLALTRFTGLDFFADGRMAVCSWDGDVWIVDGFLNGAQLTWQRIASGMFQPLGLKIVDDQIHVTCRDQLTVLHDLNGDGEIDYYQCLNNDHQVTEHFHEFAMGLQTDEEGNFYYAKSGRHALEAVVPHHGTLLKVSKDGSRTEILATGFRAANGVCLNPDGSFVVTDQEGFWNPKNRINWVTLDPGGKPKFYGNMFGYHDVTDTSDAAMEPPLCWITNAFDRSPGELLWVNSDRWGPLNGSLLNLSYGYGKVFLVPHENVDGQMQGGMIELPIPSFPTGVMRGRFHPTDGQLYLCGMFAWAGSATQPGGLYRLRATGQPMHLPLELHATRSGLKLVFTEPLDAKSIDPANIHVKTWSLKRTKNYGSEHYDEKPLTIRSASLSDDGRTLTIEADDLRPTWCMEIRYSLKSADGHSIDGTIHNTIHRLSE